MTQNLRIGSNSQSTTLAINESDITSGYTIPLGAISGFGTPDTGHFYLNSEYGGFYSWFVATAGTGTRLMTSGNATSSICPKNWRLPTGGPGSEVEAMARKYGSGTDQATSVALRKVPVPGFVLSGGYNMGQSGYCASGEGYYQTSTAAYNNNEEDSYSLYLTSSYVNPSGHSQGSCTEDKGTGKSIRCIAR